MRLASGRASGGATPHPLAAKAARPAPNVCPEVISSFIDFERSPGMIRVEFVFVPCACDAAAARGAFSFCYREKTVLAGDTSTRQRKMYLCWRLGTRYDRSPFLQCKMYLCWRLGTR
uniref:Uncharacterized protein n=1 Tax=Setaria italica TaxID=4555 RepID=K3XNA3_SETIT